jgi:hypothetical protein
MVWALRGPAYNGLCHDSVIRNINMLNATSLGLLNVRTIQSDTYEG